MPIKRNEFNMLGNKAKYKELFSYLKKNKDTAYSKKDLMDSICKKIKMSRGQLNISLYLWAKKGYLKHKRPYYIITNEGLKTDGKVRYHDGKIL